MTLKILSVSIKETFNVFNGVVYTPRAVSLVGNIVVAECKYLKGKMSMRFFFSK